MALRQRKPRALGLCSGGLDSILAGLVLREHGVAVEWVSFETPFFSADKARKASRNTGIPLTVKDITPVYMEMLRNPRCGYGQNMNPCLDCHTLMFRIAGEMMAEKNADFLFSGEVVGQRPMSQTRTSLRYVEKHSGHEGRIVRPLSIQLLPETIPEQEGLIDRNALCGISGRGRKEQIALAEKLGVTDYPAPAGGCLLTDRMYTVRLKDLFDHQKTSAVDELHLLRYGRHFRLDPHTKIIVGRDKQDNEAILRHYQPDRDTFIKTPEVPGPVVLVPNSSDREAVMKAAALCVGYSKTPHDTPEVRIITPAGKEVVRVKGMPPEAVRNRMIEARKKGGR